MPASDNPVQRNGRPLAETELNAQAACPSEVPTMSGRRGKLIIHNAPNLALLALKFKVFVRLKEIWYNNYVSEY